MLRSRAVRSLLWASALGLAALAGCRRPPPPALAEVALFSDVGDAASRVLVEAAARAGVARARAATTAAEADVLWLGDPTEVLDAAGAVAEGAAPGTPEIDVRWR